MANSPEPHASANHFNKHMLNLKNIAAVSVNADAKVSKNFAKIYNAQLQRGGHVAASEESARKSLELLQQVVQKLVNESVDNVLRQFIDKFFEPAFVNIEKNCGKNLDKEMMTVVICRRLLEEVIAQVYPLPQDANIPTTSQNAVPIKKRSLMLNISGKNSAASVAGDTASTPNSDLAAGSTPQSHIEDLSPLSMHESADIYRSAASGKSFLRPTPSTANDVSEVAHSPPGIAGRLRSLKARKRSFSDSEHLNSPPRGVRAAAQRAAEKVAAANASQHDAHSSKTAAVPQELPHSSPAGSATKRVRSDAVVAFAKPASVAVSAGKVVSQTTLLRNFQH